MERLRENSCFSCICEYFTTLVRVSGVICAIVLWIISINGLTASFWTFFYILFVAIILTVLEGLFLFESCITKCCDNDGCCGKTWVVVSFLDNWKRSILYVGLAIPCFFLKEEWTAIFSGVLLILLAILYLIRTFFFVRRSEQTTSKAPAAGDARYGEFANQSQSTPKMAERGQVGKSEEEMRYPTGDDEMGKKGDVGFGTSSSLEDRYPH